MSLIDYARALRGTITGPDRIACPGPYHSPRDRSLSVMFDPAAPDGFLVHSHAGDDFVTCKDYVRERIGGSAQSKTGFASKPPTRSLADNGRLALDIWHAGAPPAGTPVERYVHRRGVDFAAQGLPDAIRWHPECPFGGERVGCMLALVRDIVTNQPKGIHRTAIGRDGRKLTHLGSNGRRSLGPVGGGAVKLTSDDDVTLSLTIGEGLESCLSARNIPDLESLPLWCLLSAHQVEQFPVLAGIETLWIVVDHDQTGLRAAHRVCNRWQKASREVVTLTPIMAGADLNDLVRGRDHA